MRPIEYSTNRDFRAIIHNYAALAKTPLKTPERNENETISHLGRELFPLLEILLSAPRKRLLAALLPSRCLLGLSWLDLVSLHQRRAAGLQAANNNTRKRYSSKTTKHPQRIYSRR